MISEHVSNSWSPICSPPKVRNTQTSPNYGSRGVEDLMPATQCVLPLLLGDVTAFVEVRSGHDNRTMGVTNELLSLGARIAPFISNEVTHVVFQEGLVSTYRKARQHMCHVVSVSWIEASKELGHTAPEEEYPPLGYEKYDDPNLARKIKRLKSMQPDHDEEKQQERLNLILSRIKKKDARKSAGDKFTVNNKTPNASRKSAKSEEKKKNSSDSTRPRHSKLQLSKADKPETTTNRRRTVVTLDSKNSESVENEVPKQKRFRGKSFETTDTPGENSAKIPNKKVTDRQMSPARFSKDGELGDHRFAVPTVVSKQKKNLTGSAQSSSTGTFVRGTVPQPLSEVSSCYQENRCVSKQYDTIPSSIANGAKPLAFIENISRQQAYTTPQKGNKRLNSIELVPDSHEKSPLPRRSPRENAGVIEVPIVNYSARKPLNTNKAPVTACEKKFKLALTEGNPFVNGILMSLSNKKKPKIYTKSPWRRGHNPEDLNRKRRQSPRLNPKILDTDDESNSDRLTNDSDDCVSPRSDRKRRKTTPPRNTLQVDRASKHMLKFLKAKISDFDASQSPAENDLVESEKVSTTKVPCQTASIQSQTRTIRRLDSPKLLDYDYLPQISTAVSNVDSESFSFTSEASNAQERLSEEERSDSPILGTSLRCRGRSLSNSRVENKKCDSPAVSRTKLTETRERSRVCLHVNEVKIADELREKTAEPKSDAGAASQDKEDMCRLLSKSDCGPSKQRGNESGVFTAAGPVTRRRSLPNHQDVMSTLTCTHLRGSEVKDIMNAVKKLGRFKFEDIVTSRTTHLVASGPRRTVNMLRALSRGCWILKVEWVHQSLKAGKWLEEDKFELTEFSPLVKERRLLRFSERGLSKLELFTSVGRIYVSPTCQPVPAELKELIVLNGGSVVSSSERADIVIGPSAKTSAKPRSKKPRVNPLWILDCVTKGEFIPFTSPQYLV